MGYAGTETVTVNGRITAPVFAKLFDAVKTVADFTEPTIKDGYKTYIVTKGAASVTLLAKDHYLIGDVNGDKDINYFDAVRLVQYINGWPINISLPAADVNGDGVINFDLCG